MDIFSKGNVIPWSEVFKSVESCYWKREGHEHFALPEANFRSVSSKGLWNGV